MRFFAWSPKLLIKKSFSIFNSLLKARVLNFFKILFYFPQTGARISPLVDDAQEDKAVGAVGPDGCHQEQERHQQGHRRSRQTDDHGE